MDRQQLRFLGVVAHPHDFTHFSGTCGIHAALGDPVTVVCVTTGASMHNVLLEEEMAKPAAERDPAVVSDGQEKHIEKKRQELIEAAALFGVTDVRTLGYPQPFVSSQYPEATNQLADIIREVRPHVMITQSPYNIGHQGRASPVPDDHIETSVASLKAQELAGNPGHMTNADVHKIATVLFPGVYFNRDEWDFTVDISGLYEQRVQAEALYESQGHTPEFARKRIEIGAGGIGWTHGSPYAEAFVRNKAERLDSIAVSEADLRAVQETEAQHIKKIAGGSAS
jgi:LmbE family N-acetylglucosaminyl deacetylase